jgi:predicted nucleic acid-binding protein
MAAPHPVVLDTNIVLDLFLFQDPRTEPLRQQLLSRELHWIATPHMRNELERVLTYPHIIAKLEFYQLQSQDVLAHFDHCAILHTASVPKAPYICKDADDQVFIDLACARAAQADRADLSAESSTVSLISKDKAVLSLRKRLSRLSVSVSSTVII